MRLNTFLLSGSISAAMILFSAPIGAAAPGCTAETPTTSNTREFHHEADQIFQDIRLDSRQAADQADLLRGYEFSPDLSWESHADELAQLRGEVNDIGTKVCRLEQIRNEVAPWQQKTIDSIAGNLQLMADNTTDAIIFLNGHETSLWLPTYTKYISNINNEAESVNHAATNAVDYSQTNRQLRRLRHQVGG